MTQSVEPLVLNLEIPSNGDYVKIWALLDKGTGASLLASDDVLHMDIKASLDEDATPLIGLTNTLDPDVSGIVLDPSIGTNGQFTVTLRRADLEAHIASGLKKVKLWYDLGVLSTDSFFIVYAKGTLTLDMGVTKVA